jgi:HTH-type transcriptional regulator/antitoxin HipB
MEYVAEIEREGVNVLINFPDCPGCQTFADLSMGEDVLEVARDAIEGWLTSALSDGETPPRPVTTFRDPEHQVAVHLAAALGIALQVRWRRQELGLSQAQLGERMGVSRQQVALFEDPAANLRLSSIERLADVLQLQLDVALTPMGG